MDTVKLDGMTKEEACEVLDDMKVKIDIPHAAVMQRKRNEALDMAISALSTEGEYIKKEEALLAVTEALKKGFACFDEYETWWFYKGTKLSLTKVIDSIPAVHMPEPHKAENEVAE